MITPLTPEQYKEANNKVPAWKVAEDLGLSINSVYQMKTLCRRKDRGDMQGFTMSPENEARIRAYMRSAE